MAMNKKRKIDSDSSSRDRLSKHRERNSDLGINRVELQLDSIAVLQLEALIKESGFSMKEKGSKNAVVTQAINHLYERCILDKRKKVRLEKESQLRLVAKNIVTWLCSEATKSDYKRISTKLKSYPVPDGVGPTWSEMTLKTLSRVRLGKKKNRLGIP